MKLIISICILLCIVSCQKEYSLNNLSANSSTNSEKVNSTALKPQLAGLLIRHFSEWKSDHSLADADSLKYTPGFVVDVNWSELQTTKNGSIQPNIADTAITFVKQANAKYPGLNLRLKIRLYAGYFSPQWLINSPDLGGSFLHKPGAGYENTSQSDTVLPRWWQPAFNTYFQDLQNKLAAKYDSVNEVQEVTVSACGTYSAETLVHQFSNTSTNGNGQNGNVYIFNIKHALAAGFTNDLDITAQEASINAMQVWKKTRVSFIYNSYEYINANSSVSLKNDITKQLMNYFVNRFGTQAVLGNNSIRATNAPAYLPGGLMYQIYSFMNNYHIQYSTPVTFQTALIDRVGNLAATLKNAISYGAGSVELPDGYQAVLSQSQIKSFDTQLINQAAK